MAKGDILRTLLRMKHSPAGKKHLRDEKLRKEKEKAAKLLKKVTSYNYYGGANKRRKTADELLKEIKMGK